IVARKISLVTAVPAEGPDKGQFPGLRPGGDRPGSTLNRAATSAAVITLGPGHCRCRKASLPLPGGGVVSAGHGKGAAEAVQVFCRDDLREVAVVADCDPCGAGVEVFDVP